MPNLITALFIVLLSLGISSCSSLVYRPNIQQGNVVTQDMLDQLRPGMTEEQVRQILGTPLLVDTFNTNRWDYVYTFRHGDMRYHQQNVTVIFSNGRLMQYTKTLPAKAPAHS